MALLWQIAVIAREFHVLPTAVERDLYEDPEMLSMICVSLLRYSEAHAVYRSADKRAIKNWKRNPSAARLMETVERTGLELAGFTVDK